MNAKTAVKEPVFQKKGEVLAQIEEILNIKDPAIQKEKSKEFIDKRLKALTENSVPKQISLTATTLHQGFIHPDSRIRRTFIVDPFRPNDPQIYEVLLNQFQELKEKPGWGGAGLKEMAKTAVLFAIGKYFGNYWSTEKMEAKNRDFYLDHMHANSDDVDLKDLRGRAIAVCTEKAAVAQNLLAFLGYETEIVASSSCRLASPEKNDVDGHVFNVVTEDGKHSIFEPTNPSILRDKDGNIANVMPADYPLTELAYQKLMDGGQVEVTHYDGFLDGVVALRGEPVRRIYGGPKQNN